ncbi:MULTISPECIES: aspartate/glutamate racemase family protein [Roseomonadaceae]|uniref:Hydantoin racemase n=1 Tax=Falsiroseomonas oleicola TaxID=2801474 RepID=A0ABS6H8Z8_9PROT|nr:aspartate/glutamate racemase family protein [Roseomonas oleicola]MBU8545160.1 hydantoin racemase [Roseomonas oleicola]
MRILVVNANTTLAITEACVLAAQAAAAPGTEILGATPEFGPSVISTRAENAIAAHALLATLAEHAGAVDAAILAVSHDTALDAARQLMPCPVIGMTEAACLTACLLGGSFGVLTLGQARPYEELVARHGLTARCAEVVGLPLTPQQAIANPDGAAGQVLAAAEAMAARCDSVVLAGAALAGMAVQLQDRSPVPLLDGITCAVKLAEALVAQRLPKPRTGSYAAPSGRTGIGLSPALERLLRGG